jgi:imidazolonepropionase
MKNKVQKILIGPFSQVLTMADMPLKGALQDEQLQIIPDAGMVITDGKIEQVSSYNTLIDKSRQQGYTLNEINTPQVALPGLIDAHTHICYAGSRSAEYALRMAGKSYLDIAKEEGGIWYTVQKTREASAASLTASLLERAMQHLNRGITTIEVKSGYGLTVDDEIKMLNVIKTVNRQIDTDLISTCLAAHIPPKEFRDKPVTYLQEMSIKLLPSVKEAALANRVDIYIDQGAFTLQQGRIYLEQARKLGFDITVHADQFSTGGSELAVEYNAVSADHLETSGKLEIERLAQNNVIAVALPGSSIGLGMPFAPVRKLLNAGASLAIASDWNPGSAPMGDLLVLAAILAIYEKLSSAELFAALTFRAAAALGLPAHGRLIKGHYADIISFSCEDYREILYQQGALKPEMIWKKGKKVK